MDQNSKIIILYSSYGYGHYQVSKALQHCLIERGHHHVQMIDLYAVAHPTINAGVRFVYLKICSLIPQLYGWSYYLTQNMQHDRIWVKWLNHFGISNLKKIMLVEKPNAVIITFPIMAMPELRKQTGLNIPIFAVLTDHVIHNRWIHPEIDKYFVANEELKAAIINKGIPAERIVVSGIPLRMAFRQTYDKKQILQRYGLDPAKKIVLILAGAYGVLRNSKKICQELLQLENIEVIIVCGKNKSLIVSMEASFPHESRLHVLGFVEQMHELMAISSCMVTKAGGITLSEALALNLPIIVFRPLPGQEKDNALFLAKKGAVLIAYQTRKLGKDVQQVLNNSDRLIQMEQAIYELQKKNATETVVNDILHDIDQEYEFKR